MNPTNNVPRLVPLLLRIGLGGLLLWSGAIKIVDGNNFAVEISNYRFFSEMAPWLALLLPGIELVTGCVLLAGNRAWVRSAALLSSLLMAMFTVAVAQVVARGINISCGCFGGNSGPVTILTVGRDVLLLAASIALVALTGPEPGDEAQR